MNSCRVPSERYPCARGLSPGGWGVRGCRFSSSLVLDVSSIDRVVTSLQRSYDRSRLLPGPRSVRKHLAGSAVNGIVWFVATVCVFCKRSKWLLNVLQIECYFTLFYLCVLLQLFLLFFWVNNELFQVNSSAFPNRKIYLMKLFH